MARPNKEGLDYFELDCQLDEKIRLIQAQFGLKGFAIVVKLFQKIYGEHGYYCDFCENGLFLFMLENGVSSDGRKLIEDVVRACIKGYIFSEDLFLKYGILTSSGIQKRYLNAVSRREHVEMKKEYLLINCTPKYKNVVINSINVDRNSVNVSRNTQRRVEKSKEENIYIGESDKKPKKDTEYFEDKDLNHSFNEFVEFRKNIKKPMTNKAISLAINKLKKLSSIGNGNIDINKAIDIINQSILKNWSDLYPISKNKVINSNNFSQRDNDLDAIANKKMMNKLSKQ